MKCVWPRMKLRPSGFLMDISLSSICHLAEIITI
jgi:hypothetical protein